MSQIKIKRIKPQTVPLYNPDGEYMGDVNEYEFEDIKTQIAEKQLSGYYVKFENEHLWILPDGDMKQSPKGFFNLTQEYLVKRIKLIIARRQL